MSFTVVLTTGSQPVALRSSRQTLACIHNAEVTRVAARAIRAKTACCMTLLTFAKLRVHWVCSNNLRQLAGPRMETTWVFCRLGLLFSGKPLLDIRDYDFNAITKVNYFYYYYYYDDGDDDFPVVLGSHDVFCQCGYADAIGIGLS